MTKDETSVNGDAMKSRLRESWRDADQEALGNLETMTPAELFDAWADYEGLVGYSDTIIQRLRESGYMVMEVDEMIRVFEENRKQLSMLCGRASLLLQFPGDPRQLLEDLVTFGKDCGAYREESDGQEG